MALRSSVSVLFLLLSAVSAYFLIDEPHRDTQWVNNQANLISWRKGLLDGIEGFDMELARLNSDGLTLVARNVPVNQHVLNIFLQDVPAGDDYFLIFINSTHGVMHATSPRFSILASGSNPKARTTPDATAPTITASGAPDPTKAFATTFPALAGNGATSGRMAVPAKLELYTIVLVTLGCIAIGGLWTMS